MQNASAVRRVLYLTLALNLLVAFGKIVLGALTGALSISADGLHSLVDSAGNVAGLIAIIIAQRPADADHPYGHRRFETLAALLIGALLLLTAWEMLQGGIERLYNPQALELSPLAFGVMIVTLVVNIGVSRYQIRAGQRLKSEILLADAKNTSADVLVSSSVIVSMVVVRLTGWAFVDTIAALAVAGLIGKASWDILTQTGRVLVDTAPYTPEELAEVVQDIPQGCSVVRARSRGAVDNAYIDIDLHVPPHMTTAQTYHLEAQIRERLESTFGGIAEIEIHFAPMK